LGGGHQKKRRRVGRWGGKQHTHLSTKGKEKMDKGRSKKGERGEADNEKKKEKNNREKKYEKKAG